MSNNKILSIFLGFTLICSGHLYADEDQLRGQPFLDNRNKVASMPADWVAKDIAFEESARDADLVITLNQDTYPILHDEVDRYAKANGLKIVMHSGTCGTSAGKLMHKNINSGAFCCPPGDMDRLPGLEFHTIAISAVAVIVNGKNPVDNISLDEARSIFRGKIRHWKDLENQQSLEPIITTARLHCKNRPGHWTLLLSKQELFSPTLIEVGVIPDLVAKVAQERNVVSIETPGMVKEFSKPGTVKMLKINGHAPTDTAYVAYGKYPFYRTFNMTTWSNNSGKREQTMKLIEHLRQYIEENYESAGLVPVSMLKAAGWKFTGDELVGEPTGTSLTSSPHAGN